MRGDAEPVKPIVDHQIGSADPVDVSNMDGCNDALSPTEECQSVRLTDPPGPVEDPFETRRQSPERGAVRDGGHDRDVLASHDGHESVMDPM